jgi:hypothetical protein
VRDLDVHRGQTIVVSSEDLHASARTLTVYARHPSGAKVVRNRRIGLTVHSGEYRRDEVVRHADHFESTPAGFQVDLLVSAPEILPLVVTSNAEYADDRLRCWRELDGKAEVLERRPA